jgi:hypothetical protein
MLYLCEYFIGFFHTSFTEVLGEIRNRFDKEIIGFGDGEWTTIK